MLLCSVVLCGACCFVCWCSCALFFDDSLVMFDDDHFLRSDISRSGVVQHSCECWWCAKPRARVSVLGGGGGGGSRAPDNMALLRTRDSMSPRKQKNSHPSLLPTIVDHYPKHIDPQISYFFTTFLDHRKYDDLPFHLRVRERGTP